MPNQLSEFSDYLTGKSKVPPNPDIAHNILLLGEAKKKIETGILTRYLKRPTVLVLEIAFYACSILLFLIAVYFWGMVTMVFDAWQVFSILSDFLTGLKLNTEYDWIRYVILFSFLWPSIICFLLARSFTRFRRRTNVFIQVENTIERVVYNLKGSSDNKAGI